MYEAEYEFTIIIALLLGFVILISAIMAIVYGLFKESKVKNTVRHIVLWVVRTAIWIIIGLMGAYIIKF